MNKTNLQFKYILMYIQPAYFSEVCSNWYDNDDEAICTENRQKIGVDSAKS